MDIATSSTSHLSALETARPAPNLSSMPTEILIKIIDNLVPIDAQPDRSGWILRLDKYLKWWTSQGLPKPRIRDETELFALFRWYTPEVGGLLLVSRDFADATVSVLKRRREATLMPSWYKRVQGRLRAAMAK
ncbi:uncharacterized protein AB675_11371 [Cyphellophora attinorum]|uniref:Uncharacterized protein n=1 Tax=Cyphellophora attinorum TaxID=1664694 RepID=A0A0N1P0Z9_9EURO|nr:uncharacterized protein AB675_11371 [Phialophora attinorum]KPI39883.1 hypothetical protein AB675_11371 [Phialophora attinorum]